MGQHMHRAAHLESRAMILQCVGFNLDIVMPMCQRFLHSQCLLQPSLARLYICMQLMPARWKWLRACSKVESAPKWRHGAEDVYTACARFRSWRTTGRGSGIRIACAALTRLASNQTQGANLTAERHEEHCESLPAVHWRPERKCHSLLSLHGGHAQNSLPCYLL